MRGEVYYFDFGCLAFWGLSERQEREVLGLLVSEGQRQAVAGGGSQWQSVASRRGRRALCLTLALCARCTKGPQADVQVTNQEVQA